MRSALCLLGLLLVGASMTNDLSAAPAPVTFTVTIQKPEAHLYQIEMTIPPFGKEISSFELVLPAWIPGSYLVRNFARHVRDLGVTAAEGGPAVALSKVDKSRWRVQLQRPFRGPFVVRYRVYANDLSVRGAHLDASHGYGNGAGLFFYVEGRKTDPQAVRFVRNATWKVSVALPQAGEWYQAADYDELVDSPFECGTHRTYDFEVRGKPHTLALWGHGNEDPERLTRDLAKIVEAGAQIFGGLPYDRYLFLVHLSTATRGGLEHRASQSDGVSPFRFKPEKSYRSVLLLFAHEFFHCWNVKRIRPAALGPFDYTREVYTKDLWAMEGVTSYYEGLLLVRAGLFTPAQLFEEWSKDLKEHRDNPGTQVQSAELSSFDAWIRQYLPDENSPNVAESYYRRGALIGLALDLTIRSHTNGARSLDDVLRALYTEYALKGVGYPEGAYEAVVERFIGAEAHGFFDRYVRGLVPLDFETLLRPFGVVLSEKADKDEDEDKSDGADDKPADKAEKPVKTKADFGWKTKAEAGKLTVTEVYEGRAAHESGVNAGDELVALDGFRADADQLKRLERDASPGSVVNVSVFRRDELLELPLTLTARRAFKYEMKADREATDAMKTLFSSWTGQPLPEKKKKD